MLISLHCGRKRCALGFWKKRPLGSHLLQPLGASVCEWLQVAAKWLLEQVAAWASGCQVADKWLQVAHVAASICQVSAKWLLWQVAASGCKWLQVAASGCKWLQVAASGCKWLQVAASGCRWLQVAALASGCKWLQVAASGCLSKWLQVAVWASGNSTKRAAIFLCFWFLTYCP